MQIPGDLYSQNPDERRQSSPRRIQFHWRQRWREWIHRRLPPQRSIHLNHHNIFIFPTRAGFGYLGFIFLLLLVAINFENSAVYSLTFLLGGIFAVSILHTFGNLLNLKLTGTQSEHAFSGRDAIFEVLLAAKGRRHLGVQLSWQDKVSERIDISKQEEKRLALRYRTGLRGYCNPGRLKVESAYPLGLIRAWTWIDLNLQTIVYPYPDSNAGSPSTTMVLHDLGNLERSGSDDFFGLRSYAIGDSAKSIAWKNYAKTSQLSSKQFVDYIDERMWLDWDAAHGDDEQRLMQLCHWAIAAESGHNEYGLRLPEKKILPGRGRAHLRSVLTELAIYNLPEQSASNVADNVTDKGNLQ